MHALLLSFLSLGFTDGSAHAQWHPADAGLYLEIPDASALCKLYDHAPLVRLLNDKQIQALMKASGAEDTTASVSAFAKWVGSSLGVDVPTSELQGGIGAMSLSVRYGSDGWGITVVIDVKADGLAERLKTAFHEFADSTEAHAIAGFETLNASMLPAPVWLTVQANRLAFGVSDATAKGLADRWNGGGASLATSPILKSGFTNLSSPNGTPIVSGCYTGAFPLEGLPQNAIGALLRNGLSTPVSLRTQFHDQRFETFIYGADGKSASSLGKALGHLDLEGGWLKDLPDDAMLSYATTVDGAQLATSLRGLVDGTPELAVALKAIEDKLGFGLDRMLGKLGPRLLASMQPIGGPTIPPTFAWIDSDDPAGFVKDFEALASGIGEMVPGIGARTRDYRIKNKDTGERVTVPYTTLTVPAEFMGNLTMLSPKLTFAQLDGRLLFSLSSISLKSELKRIYGGGTPAARDFVGKNGIDLPEGSRSLIVFDWNALLSKLIGVAKVFGPLLGDMLPFDVGYLPSPDTFARYLKPTIHIGRRMEGGFLREHRSSFGLMTWGGLAATMVGTQFLMSRPMPSAPVKDANFEELFVEEEKPTPDAALRNSKAALRDLKSGLAIYKIENGELPATLHVLVAATDAYPKGYLALDAVPKDGWGNDFRYFKESTGYRLWSIGPNGRDEKGDGDDLVP